LAAVFGNEFAERHLRAVAEAEGTAVDIESTDLAGVLARRPRNRIGFHHALYRDVAYEGLPFRQRRRLHEVVADTLERSRTDPRPIAGLLSLHFHQARRHHDAFRYATQAADDAMSSFAHREASQLLERALAAGRYCREVGAEDRAQLYEHLGRSLEFSGELERADGAYRRIRRLTDDLDRTVGALRRQARVRQKQNRLPAAIRLLRRALRLLDSVEPQPWSHRRLAELRLNLSGIRMDQGRLDAARAEGELAEMHARAAGDDALRIQAYGAIAGATTDWAEAERLAELGLGPGAPQDAYEARSILAINLGMCAFFAGRWDRAVELYEMGRAAADAMGNVTAGALASMNAAEVLVDQGRLSQAGDALAHVQRVLGAAGYQAALLYAEMLRATIDVRHGRIDEGVEALTRCATEFRDGSMLMYALESELRIAEARLRAGDLAAALDLARQAVVEAEQLARRAVIRVRAERVRGLVAAAGGDPSTAVECLSDAVRTCRDEGLRYELALTLDALVEAAGPSGRGAERAEADRIFDELGVDRAVVTVSVRR
jgi:tetratricopeptide (TPR) repeat protein